MDKLISLQAAIDAIEHITSSMSVCVNSDECHGMKRMQRQAVIELANLPSAQPVVKDANAGDINKFIDDLEEIFADLRERHVDDSVCGLCEYDGAYIGQSGDWCNECPGFDRDDCFKLSDECRKRWIDTIIKAMPSAEQRWIPCSETEDLPKHEVLCCDKYGEELIGWLLNTDGDWMCESDGELMADPIAWREKPEPWRGEEHD